MRIEAIEAKELFDSGTEGKCYRLNNGSIFKLFHIPQEICVLQKYHKFSKYKTPSIHFPYKFIYDKQYFYGHLSKEALGSKLEDCFHTCNLEQLAVASQQLEKDILRISKDRIIMHDFHPGNIKYDGNKLGVYDVDDYEFHTDKLKQSVIKENLSNYKIMIGNLFIYNIGYNPRTKYIIEKVNKNKYSDNEVSDMIINLKIDMEGYFKETINSLEDVRNIIGIR